MRHSQPKRLPGCFDAFCLDSRMLTFSECRTVAIRKGRHPESREASPADSVLAAPTWLLLCALVLRYDTAARSVAVRLRVSWWI